MQKKTLLYLLIFVLTPLLAQNHPDRGFYGSLGLSYLEETTKNNSDENSRESFLQEFKLGYKGNIYSPKLLDYTLEGMIRYDKEDTQKGTYHESRKSNGTNYRANLDFIKATNYPFTIFASKIDNPVSTVYSAYTTNYMYESQSEGIRGRVDLEPYLFTYGMTNTETLSEYRDRVQTIETVNYNTSLRYSKGAHNAQIRYLHVDQTNAQKYINNSIVSVDQTKDTINLTHKWKISEDLLLDSGLNYENDEYYYTTRTDANFNLRWKPKEKDYDGSVSVNGSRLEYADENGSTGNVFDTININQRFNYRLTPNLNLSENIMMYTFDSAYSKGSNTYINLMASHNYKRTIFKDTPFSVNTKLSVQKNDSETKTIRDNNTTTSTSNVERYNLYIGTRATEQFPSIKSKFNFLTGFDFVTSSANQDQQRYNVNMLLDSKIFTIVSNSLSARYMMYNSSSNGSSSSSTSMQIMESMNFFYRLGIKGRVGFNLGVVYENLDRENESTSRFDPRAEMNLNYRLFRRWRFDSKVSVRQIYNTLDYTGNANLIFTAGKTNLSIGYQYNKSEVDNDFGKVENERTIFRVKLTRRF